MSRTSWPAGLLGMVVLVAAVEGYLARHGLDFSNTAALKWCSAEASARRVRNCEVVCLGSSLITTGALPRVVEDRLGRPAFNLSVPGGTTPSSYFLMKRVLESGASPKVVVLDCQDPALDGDDPQARADLWIHARLWPEILTLPECLDLAWTAGDANLFGALAASKALPSARSRFEIRAKLAAALEGQSYSQLSSIAGVMRNWQIHRGAHVMAARGRDEEAPASRPSPPVRRARWAASRVTEAYTRRLLDLLARRGIAVFWTFPPIGPRATAWRDQNGSADFATRSAERAQARSPGITVVDGRRAQYPPRVFADDLHLGVPGAVTFSRDLASVIALHFEAPATLPRSVVLPPYRDGAAGLALEDVEQSCRVVVIESLRRPRRRTRR